MSALRQEQRQQTTLTPRLQQAVRLLQLSSLDFAQEVQQAMGTNPFLEPDEVEGEVPGQSLGDRCTPEALDFSGKDGSVGSESPADLTERQTADHGSGSASDQDAGESSNEANWEGDGWSQYGNRRNNAGDGNFELSDITPADVSLREFLRSQLGLLPSSERDRAIMNTIVEALDDDGYLRVELQEVGSLSGLDPAPDEDELNIALKLVQSLEPAGVAARALKECLLLQLREPADEEQQSVRELAIRIVTDHLDRLAMRDSVGVARSLGVSLQAVDAAAQCIRRLEPRPVWRYGAAGTSFVTPDVLVRKHRGIWTVSLNTSVVPRVRLNRMYADLFHAHRDASHSGLAAELDEARWTVRNVEQRFATIVRVAQAIVQRQSNFLEYGELAMKPLGLREIADEVGLHVSTVSRVTNNKYMATPLGVFELKFFFSRALATSSGGTCSTTAIRGAIKEMIGEEDATHPLSDAHIARLLSRQGLKVARRTVTKYRQMMKVPPYDARRRERSSSMAR